MALFMVTETTATGQRIARPWPWTYWLMISVSLLMIIGLVFGAWRGISWIVDRFDSNIVADNVTVPEIQVGTGEVINAEINLEKLQEQSFEIRGIVDRIDPNGKEFNFFEAIGRVAAISASERVVILTNNNGSEFSEFYIPQGIPIVASALGQTVVIGPTTYEGFIAADLNDIKLGDRIQLSVCYSPYESLPQIQSVAILR